MRGLKVYPSRSERSWEWRYVRMSRREKKRETEHGGGGDDLLPVGACGVALRNNGNFAQIDLTTSCEKEFM